MFDQNKKCYCHALIDIDEYGYSFCVLWEKINYVYSNTNKLNPQYFNAYFLKCTNY